jgi:hypothetical protein
MSTTSEDVELVVDALPEPRAMWDGRVDAEKVGKDIFLDTPTLEIPRVPQVSSGILPVIQTRVDMPLAREAKTVRLITVYCFFTAVSFLALWSVLGGDIMLPPGYFFSLFVVFVCSLGCGWAGAKVAYNKSLLSVLSLRFLRLLTRFTFILDLSICA